MFSLALNQVRARFKIRVGSDRLDRQNPVTSRNTTVGSMGAFRLADGRMHGFHALTAWQWFNIKHSCARRVSTLQKIPARDDPPLCSGESPITCPLWSKGARECGYLGRGSWPASLAKSSKSKLSRRLARFPALSALILISAMSFAACPKCRSRFSTRAPKRSTSE